jgi:hypothetical protein
MKSYKVCFPKQNINEQFIDVAMGLYVDSKLIQAAFNFKHILYILHYSKCIHCARQLYGFAG